MRPVARAERPRVGGRALGETRGTFRLRYGQGGQVDRAKAASIEHCPNKTARYIQRVECCLQQIRTELLSYSRSDATNRQSVRAENSFL